MRPRDPTPEEFLEDAHRRAQIGRFAATPPPVAVPYTTSTGVQVGSKYVPPERVREQSRDALRLQAALLDKRGRLERLFDWLDAHPWLTLSICSAAIAGWHWLTGPA
jgi:hypothetical protein